MNKVIFLSGIHGVGKVFISKQIEKEINIIGMVSFYDYVNIISECLYKRDDIHFDNLLLDKLQKSELLNTKKLLEELCVSLSPF